MRVGRASGRGLMALTAATLLIVAGPLAAQPNLLTNGDFEIDAEGTITPPGDFVAPGTVVTGWRAFSVAGAGGAMTVTSAAGRSGKGVEIVRTSGVGDSALDRDDAAVRVPIPAEQRIYKFTVDARDGGPFGTPALALGAQFQNGAFNRGMGFDPGAGWETYGLTARSDGNPGMSVRMDVGAAANRSVHVDNAGLVDATLFVNRMVNGGFEGSATGLPNWRFFSVGGTAGSVALSNDAASGANAALLTVTADTGTPDRDIGLDIDPFRLAVLPGEEIRVTAAAKKALAGDTRLRLEVASFDAGGVFLGSLASTLWDPGLAAYETFSAGATVPANVSYINIGFRVMNPNGVRSPGAYLIDDVSVMGIPEPASLLLLLGGAVACLRRRRW